MARKNHAIDRHLGARVRFARIEKRISQGALGEQLGISFQQVQKYELGKDRISASQLMNIARILDKDISFFFEDISADGTPQEGHGTRPTSSTVASAPAPAPLTMSRSSASSMPSRTRRSS